MNLLKKSFVTLIAAGAACMATQAQDRLPEYTQARTFTADKLESMLFSTSVDPHWTPKGDRFWYSYKTADGTKWYLVNPATRSKTPLWDNDRLAAQITEITHDPYDGRHLPVQNLRALENSEIFDHIFFKVLVSSSDTTAFVYFEFRFLIPFTKADFAR